MTIEVSLNSAMWPSTSTFPCERSIYSPEANVCDFFIHGWQTLPGEPDKVRGWMGRGRSKERWESAALR